jgi:long-subunit acyl-CoA synthetase (AMP-forming)
LSVLDNINVTCEHLSHIVFTSGEPKMVELHHRNIVSYIGACLLECNDIIVQHASVAFDAHIEEISVA